MAKEGTTRRSKDDIRKKKKDPNAPKRSLSAYMFFASENRETVRTENPGIAFGQIGRILGERWRALSVEEKEPYEAKAANDKKRYESEKAQYAASKADAYEE
ncbi:hypothetical protein DV495_004543 [Geotrichum candidum]|nr:hypothetical protein DV454_000929 [Geotrichum candidum]KAF5120482.1 hypothetical protein DV495_004543 [Geotrichum candidum]